MPDLLRIEPLDPAVHDRAGFDCGIVALNDYLAKRARRESSSGVSACFVATATGSSGVIGYYTLSAAAVRRTDLPAPLLKGLPRYPDLPATLLGRLAVAASFQSQGVGGRLLVSAMSRSYEASREIASLALITDPKDDAATAFYMRYGFRPLGRGRLFLTMKEVGAFLSLR